MRLLCVAAMGLMMAGCANEPKSSAILQNQFTTSAAQSTVRFGGGEGLTLVGHLRLPAAQFEGKRAAIVFQHGCGGPGANGKLSMRHQAAMDWAVAQGMVALHVDSLSPRGEKELCTQKFSERKITQKHRVADAYAGLAYLADHSRVDASRIALWGWSHGGSSVLGAMNSQTSQVQPRRFAAAVAFYPGCSAFARATSGYAVSNPTHILIGEADDWTPAPPCVALSEKVTRAGKPLSISLFPGAYHGFDDPNPQAKLRVRVDVPNGVNPGKGVTVGPNSAAREQAMTDVARFLREHLAY
jgi:dienelactone hydrolase